MNFSGILVGAAVFLSIGICHPLVIKMEYQWGKQSWWVWLVAGLAFCTLSLLVQNDILSIIIGGFAFCCLWGIHEMFLQEKRVLRGWFPENPKRHAYYEARRKELGISDKRRSVWLATRILYNLSSTSARAPVTSRSER